MSLVELATWILAAFAGAIGHEVAHWAVWLVTGRRPQLDVWKLEVVPRAGQAHTTAGDRVAAAAPYLGGAGVVAWGVSGHVALATIFGLAMIGIPSRADIDAMRGRVTWASLA